MAIIDYHSHILPGMDDGSRNTEESLEMLTISGRQKVDVILATSHFYARKDRIESFLNRRQNAYESLLSAIDKRQRKEGKRRIPQIRLGAEVAFFPGISRAEEISKLTLEGTDLLLLEMPFGRWTNSDLDELEVILEQGKYQVILAHIERFLMVSANKKYVYELLDLPLHIQVNAGSLLDWKTRSKTLKILNRKGIGLLGSDCHGIRHREPNLAQGREIIRSKLGEDFYARMDELGTSLLS